jgi:hypothetical protein
MHMQRWKLGLVLAAVLAVAAGACARAGNPAAPDGRARQGEVPLPGDANQTSEDTTGRWGGYIGGGG